MEKTTVGKFKPTNLVSLFVYLLLYVASLVCRNAFRLVPNRVWEFLNRAVLHIRTPLILSSWLSPTFIGYEILLASPTLSLQTMDIKKSITATNICTYHNSAEHHLGVKFAYDVAAVSMHGYNKSTFLSTSKVLMEKGLL